MFTRLLLWCTWTLGLFANQSVRMMIPWRAFKTQLLYRFRRDYTGLRKCKTMDKLIIGHTDPESFK